MFSCNGSFPHLRQHSHDDPHMSVLRNEVFSPIGRLLIWKGVLKFFFLKDFFLTLILNAKEGDWVLEYETAVFRPNTKTHYDLSYTKIFCVF